MPTHRAAKRNTAWKATAAAAAALSLMLPSPGRSQSKNFEVASIKQCASDAPRGTNAGGTSGGMLVEHCATVWELIHNSYLLFADGTRNPRSALTAIEGGPSWIDSDRFEIAAKADGNPDTGTMEGPMMQALLEERFNLKVHRETRQAPVYVLTVTKSGLKVPVAKRNCWLPLGKEPRPQLAPGQTAPPICGLAKFQRTGFDLPGETMADFCMVLSITPRHRLDRLVIDRTGITGKFDFHLEWPPDPPPSDPSSAGPPSRPDPFDAFSPALQKLGLKLAPGKGPVEVLVIDHVERPSAN